MDRYIIIRGPLGVGKTTISKLLARKINAIVVDFDRIMIDLGLDYIEGEKWIPVEKFLKADEIMLPKFKKELQDGKIMIFDQNFYHMEHIRDLERKLDFTHYVFTLKADLRTCIERDKNRPNSLGEEATKGVYDYVSAFDYGTIVNTENKTPDEIVEELCSYLL